MNFVKKNIGLLIFLILCLGGIVFLLIEIVGQNKLKNAEAQKEKEFVDFFDRLSNENIQLNDENRERAEKKKSDAENHLIKFRKELAIKRLVRESDPEYREFIALDPALAKNWMINFIDKVIEDNFDPFLKKNLVNNPYSELTEESVAENLKNIEFENKDGVLVPVSRAVMGVSGIGIVKKDSTLESIAKLTADQGDKHLMIQGRNVSDLLVFGAYAKMKNGLNPDDMPRIYKSLKVAQLVINMARECNIIEMNDFDLPRGIEKVEEGNYETTPIIVNVIAEQQDVQKFLNRLSMNKDYFFFIRNMEIKAKDVVLANAADISKPIERDITGLIASVRSSYQSQNMNDGYYQSLDDNDGDTEDYESPLGIKTRRGRRGRRANAAARRMAMGMESDDSLLSQYDQMTPISRKDLLVFDDHKEVTLRLWFDLVEFNPVEDKNN